MTVAAFLGDSITVGPAGTTYLTAMCARMGWTGVNLGESGSGYVRAPAGSAKFRDRIPDVVAAGADVVIVEGGANDVPQTLEVTLEQFVAELPLFFAALDTALPSAQVYVLTPWPCKGYRLPDEIAANTAALVAECASRGLLLIDWQPWVTGTGSEASHEGDGNADYYYWTDNIHPSQAGNTYLGTRLAFAISPPATGLV